MKKIEMDILFNGLIALGELTMSDSNYEPIASEYYDSRHITSRNFDATILAFCSRFDFCIPSNGLVLELGAGKGCTGKYCKIESSRIIQIDVSKTMLLINPREDCLQRIRCDALRLPFLSSKISVVTAFLYDPYNRPEMYKEVYRVLQDGGLFIGTLPHFVWGTALRRDDLGYDKNKAKFLTKDKYVIERDSFLMSDTEIEDALKRAGLTLIQMYDLYMPSDVQKVSNDILIPASERGLSEYTLPVVKLIIAKK